MWTLKIEWLLNCDCVDCRRDLNAIKNAWTKRSDITFYPVCTWYWAWNSLSHYCLPNNSIVPGRYFVIFTEIYLFLLFCSCPSILALDICVFKIPQLWRPCTPRITFLFFNSWICSKIPDFILLFNSALYRILTLIHWVVTKSLAIVIINTLTN